MRQANIFYRSILAGVLTETNDGEYVFKYVKLLETRYSKVLE